jgi:hypothetical protein
MNYIWNIYLKYLEQNIDFAEIEYIPAQNPSPYIEASFKELNKKYLGREAVEINGIYRFASVFQSVLNLDYKEYPELTMVLYDVILHYFTITDMRQGFCKHEFYMLFLKYDIIKLIYGKYYSETISSFGTTERTWVLSNAVKVYETGPSRELFRDVMRHVYPQSMVYFNTDTSQEILIFVGKEETEVRRTQVLLICDLFLTEDMTVIYHLYYGDEQISTPLLEIYRIPILDFQVRQPIKGNFPLVIDFGTSTTAAGTFSDHAFY